jgi:cytochrome oxidase Cu insertion factor (SCO1/SenC/PrrC family)
MARIARVTTWSVLALIALVIAPNPMIVPAAVALELGKPAPDFSLPNENGEVVTLKQFRGKKIVVLEFFGAAFAPT